MFFHSFFNSSSNSNSTYANCVLPAPCGASDFDWKEYGLFFGVGIPLAGMCLIALNYCLNRRRLNNINEREGDEILLNNNININEGEVELPSAQAVGNRV